MNHANDLMPDHLHSQERSAALAERLEASERRTAEAGARLQAAEARLQGAEAAQRLHSQQRDGQVDVALAMAEVRGLDAQGLCEPSHVAGRRCALYTPHTCRSPMVGTS